MSVKFIAIGDPHFLTNNYSECELFIEQMETLVQSIQPNFVVVLGDLLHTHEAIHTLVLKKATQFLFALAEHCKTYLIIGNHDYINNSQYMTDNHPFNSFKKTPNITICDKAIVKTIKGLKFVFCPYVIPGRFVEALNTLKGWKNAACIFAHQDFNEFSTADQWEKDYPLIVSGHIHAQKWAQKNIYYPGNTIQNQFDDGGDNDKIVAEFTFETKAKYTLVKHLVNLPKKRVIHSEISKLTISKNLNKDTKIVLNGNSQDIKKFKQSKKYKTLCERGVKIAFEMETEGGNIGGQKTIMQILGELVKKRNDNYLNDAFNKITGTGDITGDIPR